ncbi:GntR family transcriptional regulator [Collimonas pratensis]|uniref:Bacterial regulatory s, gntR family protein n=1 Tax=Collimonas pratensis TaxID=279113 RepID=A0A127QBJ4_9BURK|nr:GntR family transcriptional regulator [Collimonas pratensis]AMP06992.1 bacterial regulatory s, gntR family protein [Collimonas pratensis]
MPHYKWLANIIGTTISQGLLADNQVLPSERELAERYEASRDTVRKAVRYMEERGIIYSGHGRGTFVAPAIVRGTTRFIDSFSQDANNRGSVAGQRVLIVEPIAAASMAIAGLLNVRPGDPLIRVYLIRLMDNVPVGLHDAYFVLPPRAKVTPSQIERAGSLYKLLTEKFGFTPVEAVENLSADAAEQKDAHLLGIKKGDPLLICERITLSDRREPIEYCLMKYLSSYRYKTRIAKRCGD